ncbi:hypothetical protein ACQ859_00935 [Roseateles chitinivorans]|uniref:hypothetical protein n=1 Tax=Roseateles chitinivorans TaxID=2917965 RepID=UPI003D670B14
MSDTGHWTHAWHADCARVGLTDPSTDLGEIKRAYAKTLRKTRPDDDAQAYQALREAYDRLVAHARRHQQAAEAPTPEVDLPLPPGDQAVAAVEATAAPDVAVAADVDAGRVAAAREASLAKLPPLPLPRDDDDASPRALPVAREQPAVRHAPRPGPETPPVPAWRTPESLCEELLQLRRQGQPRLVAAVPSLREALLAMPLEAQDHASMCFAHLILETHGELPVGMIDLLRDHFGWEQDFRTERRLGAERAAALLELLREFPRPVTDPAVLREFGPTAAVARLAGSMQGRDRSIASLAAALMGYAFHLHLHHAGGFLLRRLGADRAEQQAALLLIKRVQAWQFLLMLALFFGLHLATGLDWPHAVSRTVVAGVALPLGILVFDTLMGSLRNGRQQIAESPLGRLRVGRLPHLWSWIGAALVAASGIAGHVDIQFPMQDPVHAWLVPLAILAALVGVMLAMPDDLATGMTQTALYLYLMLLPGALAPLPAGLLAAWLLAGPMVLRAGLYTPNPVWRLQAARPHGGWPALAALMTVGLPVLTSWLAQIAGLRMTLGAILLASVMPRLLPADSPPAMLALVAVGTLWLTGGWLLALQRVGWSMGRQLIRRHLAR